MSIARKLLMSSGGKKDSTFIDDVFSTYLWTGEFTGNAGTTRQIANGIDLAGKGGLVWIKQRNQAYSTGHQLYDTVRGAGSEKEIDSSSTAAEGAGNIEQYGWLNSFDSNGFTTKGGSVDSDYVNRTGVDYTSWTFRKQEGFFDVVTYTGNGTAGRTVSHNLGCVPGMIILKTTDSSNDWVVGHRGLDSSTPWNHRMQLDSSGGRSGSDSTWQYTAPTSTEFTLGNHDRENKNGDTFVAYLFAGGESTAATARSVDFDVNDGLTISNSSGDFTFGTGDYTWECWIKWKSNISSSWDVLWQSDNSGSGVNQFFPSIDSNSWNIGNSNAFQIQAPHTFHVGQWYHIAASRASGTLRMFVNGTQVGSVSDSTNYSSTGGAAKLMFSRISSGDICISNLRIIKGTGLYTSSFKPITEPLSNVSGTVLLCCQGSSSTSATVAPSGATLTAVSDPTASTDSPFDDPAGFTFGENENENIIKTGSYVGTGSAGIEVNIGFEPQLILVKSTANGENWEIYDSMRGIVDGGADKRLRVNTNSAEDDNPGFFSLRPNGFIVNGTSGSVNSNGVTFIFLAIRTPDGYVGKPAGAGTDVYTQVYGTSNSDVPAFVSGFVTDFALNRQPASSENWWTQSRLTGDKYLITNSTDPQATSSPNKWDYMNGWYSSTNNWSNYVSWMWKRHAGFDVVTYVGNSTGDYSGMSQVIPHNLGKVPEMIWGKKRNGSGYWGVYHKGLNGGTNPWNYRLLLNDTHAESAASGSYTNWYWNNTAPTATHFSVGEVPNVNDNNMNLIAFLFASVDGISKVGSYDGQGSDLTIEFGFSPRFLIVKRYDSTGDWNVFDTTRGLDATSNDKELRLNNTSAQSNHEVGLPTSTGFTFACGGSHDTCSAGQKYIYYAHA